MIWTVVLVGSSLLGVWLAPKHWYGWLISFLSEGLWAAYSLSIKSTSLLIMSGVWAVLHGRNTVLTYRRENA